MDYSQSGALGTPSQAGGQASGSEPGRLEAAAAGGRLDVAVIFRRHHADLVRLALLLVGDRASAEDVVQDVFTRLCAGGRELHQDSGLAYVRTAVVNGCRSVLRRRTLARRIVVTGAAPWREVQESAEYTAILAEDRRRQRAGRPPAAGALGHEDGALARWVWLGPGRLHIRQGHGVWPDRDCAGGDLVDE